MQHRINLMASHPGTFSVLVDGEDTESERTFMLHEAFDHQISDDDWRASELIEWADKLEWFAARLRTIAINRASSLGE